MPSSPLNVFQRIVRQWDAIHPYNAAQAICLEGTPDPQRLAEAWASTLRDLDVGQVENEGAGRRYRLTAPRDPALAALAARVPQAPPSASLTDYLSDELNHRFDDCQDGEPSLPFRPFWHASPQPAGAYHLGVVYHHWLADSVSMRVLLREWAYRLIAPQRASRRPLPPQPRGGYWKHFGPDGAGWPLDRALADGVRWVWRMKRVRRIESPHYSDFRQRFSLHCTPPGLIERLLPVARQNGLTLNDLFLAVLAQACDKFVPIVTTSKRRDLALGTIVDLRGRSVRRKKGAISAALRDAFGLFLGFTNVIITPRELADWDRLTHSIAKQSRLNQQTHAAESSMVRMTAALVAERLYPGHKLINWYRKRLPLAGGISNVNLNGDWPAEFHPHPLRSYLRVSPAGPTMPVVFTPTTLGDTLQFGLTVRESVVNRETAAAMARFMTMRLCEIAGMSADMQAEACMPAVDSQSFATPIDHSIAPARSAADRPALDSPRQNETILTAPHF